MATRFPFGFFEKSREFTSEGELIIYPAVDAVSLPAKLSDGGLSGNGSLDRGRGHDILTVRPMREGDEIRDVYWRKSTNQMVVRERAQETERDVTLSLDNVPPSHEATAAWRQHFEQRVRDVASRAVAHMLRGDAITVRTTSGDRVRADRTIGTDPVLRFLALVEPPNGPPPEAPSPAEVSEPIHAAPPASEVVPAPVSSDRPEASA